MPLGNFRNQFFILILVSCSFLVWFWLYPEYKTDPIEWNNRTEENERVDQPDTLPTNELEIFNISDVEPPGIIVTSLGGLGNQLFQYACGYALSKKFNIPLYVDIRNSSGRRPFLLTKFAIPMKHLTNFEKSTKIARITDEDILFNTITSEMIATKFILNIDYCVSEQFFREYKDELKSMFVAKVNPAEGDPLTQQWLNQITNFNHTFSANEYESVGVHIRRGDFGKDWVAPMRFFRLAMTKILELLGFKKTSIDGKGVKFFIFSDDIDQVKEGLFNATKTINELGTSLNETQQLQERRETETLLKMFDIANVFYVSDQSKNSNLSVDEEFYLMTKCRHLIVSQSTFSWWAAYLNQNENKIIICPVPNPNFFEHYKTKLKIMFKTIMTEKYFYPKEWIKIDPYFK